jgi:hypothetical protein
MDWSFVLGGAITLVTALAAAWFGHWSALRIQREQRKYEDQRRYHSEMVEAFLGFLSNLTELLGSFRRHMLLPDEPSPEADRDRVTEWNASLSQSVHRLSLFAPSSIVKKAREAYETWLVTVKEYSHDRDRAKAEQGLRDCLEKMRAVRKEMRRVIGSDTDAESWP